MQTPRRLLAVLLCVFGLTAAACTPDSGSTEASAPSTVPEAPNDASVASEPTADDLADLTDLFVAVGNADADTVVVVAQGGPAPELFPMSEVREVLPGIDLEAAQLVTVHQVQTLDPARFTADDLTFEQAQAATTESIAHLAAVVEHFVAEGRSVYVAGISYGAFVVQELLATQGNVADGYFIAVGRIDMPEAVWTVFSRGGTAGFENGVDIVEADVDEAGMGAGTPTGDRNMARLAAALGMNRYSERLADTSLANVVYVSGRQDEQVGRLSDAEVAFLNGAGATVVQYDGDHEPADEIVIGALAQLLPVGVMG